MPSKKKKYNARFPAGRIKKIMQTDEEVGKVAQAVPVIISRTLELFVESLLTKSMQITLSRNAKTLTPSHMKQCILSESRFDFLKDLVDNIPDASVQEDNENNALEVIDYSNRNSEDESKKVKPEIAANFYTEQSTSTGRTPVIQYTPKIEKIDTSKIKIEIAPITPAEQWIVPSLAAAPAPKLSFSVESLVKQEPKIHIDLSATGNFSPLPVPNLVPAQIQNPNSSTKPPPPPLHPLSNSNYGQNTSDNLYIDEDYDN